MITDNKLELGTAVLRYDEQGVLHGASFTPSLTIEATDKINRSLRNELRNIGNATEDHIKQHAELVLGGWFSRVSDIELADRNQYTITSEVVGCNKYHNGAVKACYIKFSLTKTN